MKFPRVYFFLCIVVCFVSCSKKEEAKWVGESIALLCMSDLHAAHANFASIVSAAEALKNQGEDNLLMVINGDIFEAANGVSLRSEGEIEWAFLERLQSLGQVVVNIGNHEGALVEDLRAVVDRMRSLGIVVVSNIVEKGNSEPLAKSNEVLEMAGVSLSLIGMATDDVNTYRAVHRERWAFPNPIEYIETSLAPLLLPDGLNIVLNHGGIVSDRYLFERASMGTLIVGGHDHLLYVKDKPGVLGIHTGWWAAKISKVRISFQEDGTPSFEHNFLVLADIDSDPAFAQKVASVEEEYLTNEEQEVVGVLPNSFDLIGSMVHIAEILKAASQADAFCINNTTLGASLTKGPIRLMDLNAIIRFDGGLFTTQVTGLELQQIQTLANQYALEDWDQKTGEYAIGIFPEEIDPNAQYTLAVNGWVSLGFNQLRFLGLENLDFQPAPMVTSMRQALVEGLFE